MSRFTNYFSKHVRERFTKEIELIEINKSKGDFIFTYKVLPFINLRVISKYTASVTIDNLEMDLPCEFKDDIITVRLSETYFKNRPDNFTIQLFSFGQPMRIKTRKNKNRTQYIVNGKLYNIKVKKDVHISKRYMSLDFKNENVEVNDVILQKDGIMIKLNRDVDEETSLFLSYPHKFIELPTTLINKNTLKVTGLENLTYGVSSFYFAQKENVYTMNGHLNEKKELFTDFYAYTIDTMPALTLNVKEHIVKLREFYVSEINNDIVTMKITPEQEILLERPSISIYNTKLDTTKKIALSDELQAEIPIEDLIDGFTNKKINFINSNIIYQIDIQSAYIEDEMLGRFRYEDEYLTTHFYRRKDNYLGFRVSRPRIKRRITDIKNFKLQGFIKGRNSFHEVENVIIFEDRHSQEMVVNTINDKFNYEIDAQEILNIMSRDKTIIDLYIGIRNKEGKIVTRAKLPYKNSNYKKDNFYDLKIIKEKDRDVYLLITTTPFNNLKIETFVVPKSVNTNVERDRNIWLLGERIDTAQENGYQLFKYLQSQPVEAYYVIDEESKDYKKIMHEENVLVFGSEKHYEISLKAGVLLCTHDFENILPYKPSKEFFNYNETYKVFLQHGVLGRKPAEYHKKYYDDPFDIFIVSSDSEKYDVVVNTMGYEEDEVKVTGLARFDCLPMNHKGKDILLMPTWRDWINTDERFLNSEYYYRYKNLLENKRLHDILDKYNVNINFYPHYRAQPFFNKELINTSEHIRFITLGEKSVQELLIDHALLITDYSSVSFDFTIMNKPVVYYHFDEDRFFNRGILRPVNETFLGDIAETEELLISYIEESIKNNFETNVEDISEIIKYRDHNNCERIYEAVKKRMIK